MFVGSLAALKPQLPTVSVIAWLIVREGIVESYLTLLSVDVEIVFKFPARSLTLLALTTGITVPSITMEVAVNIKTCESSQCSKFQTTIPLVPLLTISPLVKLERLMASEKITL